MTILRGIPAAVACFLACFALWLPAARSSHYRSSPVLLGVAICLALTAFLGPELILLSANGFLGQ